MKKILMIVLGLIIFSSCENRNQLPNGDVYTLEEVCIHSHSEFRNMDGNGNGIITNTSYLVTVCDEYRVDTVWK
jgi:hypothetical protein